MEKRRNVLRELIDEGLALYFPAPASFTGEHVLELHGHGGAWVLHSVLQRVLELGARGARPGEFSERAFLNDKIDLVQAEAIADLIESGTDAAARAAQLRGGIDVMSESGESPVLTDLRAQEAGRSRRVSELSTV